MALDISTLLQNSSIQNVYVQFIGIIILGCVAATLIHLFLNIVGKALTAKTKTDLDDLILHIIIKPTYLLVIVASVQIATKVVESFLKGWLWIDNVFFITYTLILTYTVSRIVSLLITRWLQVSKKLEKAPKLLNKIVSVIIYVIASLIILQHLNVEITPFIATLGIGGLAVGLALQNTLSNLFAGLHILSDEPVKVGDFIEMQGLPDVTGTVEDIGWRSTRIKTPGNNIIIIPNARLADSIIINDTQGQKEVSVAMKCSVAYGSDLDEVEKVTVTVAKRILKRVPGAVKGFEPAVRFNAFGESNIEFNTILRAQEFSAKFLITHEFIKELKKEYAKKGIEISYPIRVIHRHGSQAKGKS